MKLNVMLCRCGCRQETRIADVTRPSLGWIKGQPIQYVWGHSGRQAPNQLSGSEFIKIFWSKVEATDTGCWEWQGYKHPHGYGQVSVDGRVEGTHRVAYSIVFGVIPDGICVLHHCDNPPCCRPNHLFIGTQADNMADMVHKGRQSKGKKTIEHN